MHYRLVLRVVAILLLIIAFFMIFPIIVAVYYKEFSMIRYFLYPIGGIAISAGAIFLFMRPKTQSMSMRDGFLLVSLSWIVASLFSALPFSLSGSIPSYTDAFFETMSGYTTTGASILTDIESLPRSMLFWRSLTHWLGGMGIVVLTAAVLPLLGIGAFKLLKAEAPGPTLDKITPKVAATAKILWITYGALTIAETAMLMFGGMDLYDALTHTFGTLATGGFSPKALSVGHYNSGYIDWVITIFMILAGLNFILYFWLVTGNIKNIVSNVEFKVYVIIFLVAMFSIAGVLTGRIYDTFGMSLRFAGFQAASILTTTGYVTADYELWPAFAQIILFGLMFIGGCAGSTGGGIKVIRIVTLFKLLVTEFKTLSHPRGVFSVSIANEPVKQDVIHTIAAFYFLYISMLLVTTFVVASAGNDILSSLASALVTLGNIGPGFGKIGPTKNYFFLPNYVKWFLSFAMMAGRLELYTVLILLAPRFWKK